MKIVMLVAALNVWGPAGAAAQAPRPRPDQPAATASSDKVAAAYNQFLLGRHLESSDDIEGAIAAYKRAMALDPDGADITAELAALYMRQSRLPEAIVTANQALKIAPANREAHKVLGLVYAALADNGRGDARPTGKPDENVAKAIPHLEQALDHPEGEPDPNVRVALARLYMRTGAYDKAIPLLTALVNEEPDWRDGSMLLAGAYAGAGRNADAIAWLEQAAPSDQQLYPTLADFYEREHRWKDAAGAYAKVLERAPRNVELRTRYASALLNAGDPASVGKARDVLTDILTGRPNDARLLYLLSQAQRRLGDLDAAEATARRVIKENAKSPWGYYALAEALESHEQYQAVVDALAPALPGLRAGGAEAADSLGMLLPHLGFAYQQLGQFDKAASAFEEAHKVAPDDSAVTGYLIQAYLSAKKYSAAVDLARRARAQRPNDLRLARVEAQALRESGKADEGIAVLQDALKQHADEPIAYIALAQMYSDANHGADAVKLLQDAAVKFPSDNTIPFQLGTVYDKLKRFPEAVAAFEQVIARDPANAPALNYLGYMLAERGERLDDSVAYVKKALEIEPNNGSYLDSLGWAYFKSDKLDLAEASLKRAADLQTTNSVIQDHYGEVLFKLGRYDQAIAAWTRALAGDGDSIDRKDIDRKIRAAKQKLEKK